MVLGTLAIFRVPGEAVGGRYALIENLLSHHASPPLHTHPKDETFIVLEGELTVAAEEERIELGPGGVAAADTPRPPRRGGGDLRAARHGLARGAAGPRGLVE